MSNKRVANTKEIFKTSFSNSIASGVDQNDFNLICVGSGQSVSQSNGNLVLAAGTTTLAETIIRSRKAFRGNLDLRYSAILSQRIANNNFFVELVDVVGDDLKWTANAVNTMTFTFPDGFTNPFYNPKDPNMSAVGQSAYIGNLKGTTGGNFNLPGRGTITAVDATSVTFSMSAITNGSSGTASIFGWNYYHVLYDGTTATNAKFDAQRNGWASGDTTSQINTTASPGHIGIITVEDGNVQFIDQLAASNSLLQAQPRASRVLLVPDFDVPLFLQIRTANQSVAPASNTTMTIGFVAVEEITAETVTLNGVRPQSYQSALPVTVLNNQFGGGGAVVQGIPRGTSNSGGQPLYFATGYSANPPAVTSGRNVDVFADLIGRLVTQLGGTPQNQSRPRITLTTTTETTLQAAVAAQRFGLHGLTIANRDTVAATVDIRETTGGTIVQSFVVPAGQTLFVPFDTGLWQAAVNTNFTAQLRAATTTNAVEISGVFYFISA